MVLRARGARSAGHRDRPGDPRLVRGERQLSAVTLTGVSAAYGQALALREVSLSVATGELLVLVGPSGCGKTTALRAIAGLTPLTAGTIEIGGRDVTRLPGSERDVAMVFQSYALFPHLTVAENLGFSLAVRKRPADQIAVEVDRVAGALGLGELLARRPGQLSGGERQRVALGRAMVRRPSVFLMDEPLSNLDAQLRAATRAEIVRLQADLGTTTIYVTHDQIEALSMGHRVGVMKSGELQQVGTPSEVYARPANLFVATFLGSPPMATFEAVSDGAQLRWAGGSIERAAPSGTWTTGVRPEHVHVEGSRWSTRAPRWEAFRARVELVESLGDQNVIDLEAAGVRLRARSEPSFHPARDETVTCWIEPSHVHLFDPATGASVR